MKKYFALMGTAILIMALAAPAGAQMLTKSWGHVEIQTVWEPKLDLNTGGASYRLSSPGPAGSDITYRQIYERFRLYLQHGDEKTVRAVIGFEGDGSDWGGSKNTSAIQDGGNMAVYGTDQVQVEIKHAYLEFVIPNTPVSVTAGMQSFSIGGRLWMITDAPGVKVSANFAPHLVEAYWWRVWDQSRITRQTHDVYAAQYRLTQKEFNGYAWAGYRDDQTGYRQDHPYWVAVGGGSKFANFDLSGQFVYLGGKFEDKTITSISQDYEAFAAELLGYYQIGPGMKVGLEGYYATGNDTNKQSTKINMYQDASAGAVASTGQFSASSEARSNFGGHRTVFFWMNSPEIGYQHNKQSSFGGFWYGRATFEYSPTKWVLFNFNYLYIGDTSSGTASGTKNSPTGATQVVDKDFVGQEINLITYINIYKGLGYNIGLATFIPGDVYDVYNTAGAKTRSAETAYAINTRLRYDF